MLSPFMNYQYLLTAPLVMMSFSARKLIGSVEKKFYGVASSSVATIRMIGMATSMAIVTLLISLYVGDVGLTRTHSAELLKSFKMAFTVCSILCFGGIFASLARGNIRASVSLED